MDEDVRNERISIIVPVYNAEKYLRECVNSLLEQSYELIEIILVDDGSTDGSGVLCDAYAQKDARVKVLHQNNLGASAARKQGLICATGTYVMFVDSDDWVDSNICRELYHAIQRYHVASAMCGYVRSYPNRLIPRILYSENTILAGREVVRKLCGPIAEELGSPETMECFNTLCGRLYPLSAVMDIEMLNTSEIGTSEDLMFNLGAFSRIENVVYVPKAYYYYRKTVSTSITTSYKQHLNEQWNSLYKHIRNHIIQNRYEDVYTEALKNRIALNMLGIGLNCVSDNASLCEKTKRLKQAIDNPMRKEALSQLDISKMPIHWKFFYFCAKNNQVLWLGILLEIINRMKRIV